jgi:hypothetical protein
VPEYRVTWEIDLQAGTPTDAAIEARAIQLDSANIASCFRVQLVNEKGEAEGRIHFIDLLRNKLRSLMERQ